MPTIGSSSCPILLGMLTTFIGVGVFGAVGYVILSLLLDLIIWEMWLASLLSYVTMIPIVYAAQRHLTFRSATPIRESAPKYIVTQMFGLLLAAALPYARSASGLTSYLMFLMVAFGVAVFSFVFLNSGRLNRRRACS